MRQTDSTAKLGERVLTAKRKLEQDRTASAERYEYLKTHCPSLLDETVKSIEDTFKSCSPFVEPKLLFAWIHDAKTCLKIVLESCPKVLGTPIKPREFSWFKEYVSPHMITPYLWTTKVGHECPQIKMLITRKVY